MRRAAGEEEWSDDDDDDDDGAEKSQPAHGLTGEESYRGEPAMDFDTSRADAVLAFKNGIGLGASGGGASTTEPGKEGGTLWTAWSNAASKGVKPVDFGFLMGSAGSKEADMDDSSPVAAQGAGIDVDQDLYAKKRARADVEMPEDALALEQEGEASRGSRSLGAVGPPCPPRRPKEVFFGRVPGEERGESPMDPPVKRTDVFSWMKGASGDAPEEVLRLLREENEYTQASQRHLDPLREILYKEMMGHQKEEDETLLIPHEGGYGYFSRYFIGKSYQVHYRRRKLPEGGWGPDEFVLDENEIAIDPADGSKRPYCSVSGPHPDTTHTLFAYGTDFAGSDSTTMHILPFGVANRETAATSSDARVRALAQIELEDTDGSAHWSPSGDRIYYVCMDSEFRAYKVKSHLLGSEPHGAQDAVIYEENDKKYSVCVCQSSCNRFLIISTASAETSESYLLDLTIPEAGLRRVARRQSGHSYGVDHRNGYLYVLTNKDGVKNSKVCRFPLLSLPDVPLDTWEEVWLPSENIKLDSHCCFLNFMVLEGREKGEPRIFVHNYGEGDASQPPVHRIEFPDAAAHSGRVLTPRGAMAARAVFSVGLTGNNMFATEMLWYTYSSFTVPGITYEYHVASRRHRVLKMDEVPNFDPDLYRAERIKSERRDVPISMVYRKDLHPDGLVGGPFPLLLTGYGAYGCCQDPEFDGNRLSLLDRGMVYVVAHIRGGGELGQEWREAGKSLQVKNRFADFIDVAETLVSLRVTSPSQLCAWGTSSGGLLVTASVNLRPDLFRALLLEVPFTDALNTMADPSIPLTVGEWEEIGNPNEREYFYYMLEYSPYDNIRMEAYPAAFVTASLNDAMVGYWEPLKYVSKLRALKTDNRQVLLQCDFHAGHGATSDRYQSTKESAFQFAFLLDQLGLSKVPLLPRTPTV